MIPILDVIFKMEEHQAIALSLVLVGITAFLAAVLHSRDGHVSWRGGLIFAVLAAPTNLLGSWLNQYVPGKILLVLFGILMLVTGTTMLRVGRNPQSPSERNLPVVITSCATVGFLTGFLGVGGGMLIVPALLLFMKIPMKTAIGTGLLVIAANCAVALVKHQQWLVDLQLKLIVPLAVVALAGTFIGVKVSRRIQPKHLKKAFGVFVITIGILMVIRKGIALF